MEQAIQSVQSFFKRKDVVISAHRYGIDAMGAMAQGLFASLLIGTIIKTLGHKMVKLHPINGFAAETSSATILTVAAHYGMPVSTTHSISTAIMGVGFAKNPRALKMGVIERIVWAWILTIPAAGGIAYGLLRLLEAMGWA